MSLIHEPDDYDKIIEAEEFDDDIHEYRGSKFECSCEEWPHGEFFDNHWHLGHLGYGHIQSDDCTTKGLILVSEKE